MVILTCLVGIGLTGYIGQAVNPPTGTVAASTGRTETLLSVRNTELQKGFDGLVSRLTQIQTRMEELETFVTDTNVMISTCIKDARETSTGFSGGG